MTVSIGVIGLGASGIEAAMDLAGNDTVDLLYNDSRPERMLLASQLEGSKECDQYGSDCDVVILATPAGDHATIASRLLSSGRSVVSMSDRPSDIAALLKLDLTASEAGLGVVVGAAMAPGLSCLMARHAANRFTSVSEILISRTGTGGPACARQHHRALKRSGRDLVEGQWILRRGGSGRDLVWFPDPIGARDCYRGSLASPMLLHMVYPNSSRISERMSANRRDRFSSRLPMLRKPHADGGPGAVRVEVRGIRQGAFETTVYGVMSNPSRIAGLVAAMAAVGLADNLIGPGAAGLAAIDEPKGILNGLMEKGLRLETIESN